MQVHRFYLNILGCMLVIFFATSGIAQQQGSSLATPRAIRVNNGSVDGTPFLAVDADGDSFAVVNTTGHTVVTKYVGGSGTIDAHFGNGGTVTVPGPIRINDATFFGGRVVLSGGNGLSGSPSTKANIVTTQAPNGDILTFEFPVFDPGNSISAVGAVGVGGSTKSTSVRQEADEASVASPSIVALLVESNGAGSQFRTAISVIDLNTGQLVTSFGNGGHVFVQGNFEGKWIAATPDGVVIGGVSRDFSTAGIAAANFDLQGNPGTCGATAKNLLPTGLSTNAAFYDSGSGLVTFVGSGGFPSVFYGRQLKRDCTLNTTALTYPTTNVAVGGVTGVSGDTMAMVLTELSSVVNGISNARVALYSIAKGGAPTAISPIIASADAPAANAGPGNSGPGGLKAVALAGTYALSVAVQTDAEVVITGTTSVAGARAMFTASYVGVESTTPVVEFYNSNLVHYFITADPIEASAIDAGSAGPGWSRTGQTWKSGGPARVCRFYGIQSAGGPNGHFYTINPDECAAVKQDPGWHFESYDFSGWPLQSPGVCPAGTNPIKRAYNGRFAQHDSNHRYATNDTIYNQMIGLGWTGEGVVFCAVQ